MVQECHVGKPRHESADRHEDRELGRDSPMCGFSAVESSGVMSKGKEACARLPPPTTQM